MMSRSLSLPMMMETSGFLSISSRSHPEGHSGNSCKGCAGWHHTNQNNSDYQSKTKQLQLQNQNSRGGGHCFPLSVEERDAKVGPPTFLILLTEKTLKTAKFFSASGGDGRCHCGTACLRS